MRGVAGGGGSASVAAACVGVAAGCAERADDAWRAGARHEIELVATRRFGAGSFRYTPERAARVHLRVDSVRGDSVYGSYEADLGRFAVAVCGAPSGRFPFEGAMDTGRISLELCPNSHMTHIGLLLHGLRDAADVSGTWETESVPLVKGTFRSPERSDP
jgi:hypothetical protein